MSFLLEYQAQESKEFAFHVYAGPKDYAGLASLGHEQKKVMQFGVFWWISEPFSWVLNKLHGVFGSYGLAIIVLTILVKVNTLASYSTSHAIPKEDAVLAGANVKIKGESIKEIRKSLIKK